MPESFATIKLHRWVQRMQAGDREAQDELLRCVGERLERLARRMLRDFPRVRRLSDTGDILQNATLRLLRALGAVNPDSTRAFFALAAEQVRRELLDLVRQIKPMPARIGGVADAQPAVEPVDPCDPGDGADLDRWAAFHEQVAQLLPEEREVVGLIFYHGWTQAQAAELFQVSERTIRRWWVSAQLKLQHSLRDAHD